MSNAIRLLLYLIFLAVSLSANAKINISQTQTLRIAAKIWYNENGGSIAGLTDWNAGEAFASVGIGHFVWYPAGVNISQRGEFAQLLRYLQAHGVIIPTWLQSIPHCPWLSRADFMAARNSPLMVSLRQFLVATTYWQARFMIERMQHALPRIIASAPRDQRAYLRKQIERIAQTPEGVYALVDYINFKGEGIGYDFEHGWGLLQVLQMMRYAPASDNPLQAFVWAADAILTRRVEQAPPAMQAWRWLPGWRHRLRSYIYPLQQ